MRASAIDKRSGFTVGGILGGEAESIFNEFGLSDVGRKNFQTSQQIAQLERAGRAARFNGANELSTENFRKANQLRAGLNALTADEQNPMAKIDKQIAANAERDAVFQQKLLDGVTIKAP